MTDPIIPEMGKIGGLEVRQVISTVQIQELWSTFMLEPVEAVKIFYVSNELELIYFFQNAAGKYHTMIERNGIADADLKEIGEFIASYMECITDAQALAS